MPELRFCLSNRDASPPPPPPTHPPPFSLPQLCVFDDTQNQWTLSRALLSVIVAAEMIRPEVRWGLHEGGVVLAIWRAGSLVVARPHVLVHTPCSIGMSHMAEYTCCSSESQ